MLGLAAGELKRAGERVSPPDIGLEVTGGNSSCQMSERGKGVEMGRMPQGSGARDDETTTAMGAGGAAAVEDSERWYTVFPERGVLLPGEKLELRLTVLVSAARKPRTHDPSINSLSLPLSVVVAPWTKTV